MLIFFTWKFLVSNKVDSTVDVGVISISPQAVSHLCLVVFNVGLMLVDHIHFQYNGVLMGLLVATIYFAQQKNYFAVAWTFGVLVLMKHLFATLAPIVGIFLIAGIAKMGAVKGLIHLMCIIFIVVTCLVFAFGPFYIQENGVDQILQIFRRLFPFGRGLVHAYWAPNVWALYCFTDKIGGLILQKIGFLKIISPTPGFNSTSGLVGEFALTFLPKVTATHCLSLTILFSIPAMIVVFKHHSIKIFIRALVHASLTSFLFGYHVHEKAIIIPWVLLSLCAESVSERFSLMLLSTVGVVSLFPLIPGKFEFIIKGKCCCHPRINEMN